MVPPSWNRSCQKVTATVFPSGLRADQLHRGLVGSVPKNWKQALWVHFFRIITPLSVKRIGAGQRARSKGADRTRIDCRPAFPSPAGGSGHSCNRYATSSLLHRCRSSSIVVVNAFIGECDEAGSTYGTCTG